MRNAATFTLFLSLFGYVTCFTVSSHSSSVFKNRPSSCTSLSMAPKFDKQQQKWVASSPDEELVAGYGPAGSLLRQGPAPFIQRIVNADEYDQAVLKFMAGEGCSRDEAQASMDAYLRNPSDWAYNRMEEEKFGKKFDYLTLKTDQIALTLVWSLIVVSGAGRAVFSFTQHENFWAFLPWYTQ